MRVCIRAYRPYLPTDIVGITTHIYYLVASNDNLLSIYLLLNNITF